jgi:UrcA family protein
MSPQRVAVRLLLALALAGAAPAVLAAAPTASIRIPYDDLDLTTDDGIAILYGRVRHAARQVCGVPGITGTRIDERTRGCIRNAVARAVGQLGVPALATLHGELQGGAALGRALPPGAECRIAPVAHRRIII